MQVYVNRDGQNFGPYSIAQLSRYLEEGNFNGEDLACHDGANWIRVKEIPGFPKQPSKAIELDPNAKAEKNKPEPVPKKSKAPFFLLAAGLLLTLLVGVSLFLLFDDDQKDQAAVPKTPVKNHSDLFVIKPEQVVEVYDGDTFKIDLEGLAPIFGEKLSIRVKGIDTPEMRGTSEEVKALAVQARALTEDTLKGAQRIELRNPERGKYFRIVAEVWVDGKTLAAMLKDKGLAKDYDGEGERPEWE